MNDRYRQDHRAHIQGQQQLAIEHICVKRPAPEVSLWSNVATLLSLSVHLRHCHCLSGIQRSHHDILSWDCHVGSWNRSLSTGGRAAAKDSSGGGPSSCSTSRSRQAFRHSVPRTLWPKTCLGRWTDEAQATLCGLTHTHTQTRTYARTKT